MVCTSAALYWYTTGGLGSRSFWYFRNTGVFNIHKEPKKFIQVIFGLLNACTREARLRIWRKLSNDGLSRYPHTFSEEIKIDDYVNNAYPWQWVIQMPVRDTNGKSKTWELVVTTKALSVARAECMQGRITVVWVICKLKDVEAQASYQIYILKQTWQPKIVMAEGVMYLTIEEAASNYIGRVSFYEGLSDEDIDEQHAEIPDLKNHKPQSGERSVHYSI
ncbi:hypothetical protein J132_07202 [Termitomyces sp. J132]|nr:hypothetical protein J132_07202 [Termitomyces sp. J132]